MNKVKEFFKKIWDSITGSKLNVGMFVTGVIAFTLLIVIICIVVFRGDGITNELIVTNTDSNADTEATTSETETTKDNEDETEEYSTKIDESETTNIVNKAGLLKMKTTINRSWVDDGEYFIQYNIDITNVSGKDIDGWAIILNMDSSYSLVDAWNFTYKEGIKKIVINPVNSNKTLEDGETVSGGFIVKGNKYVYIDYYTAYVGSRVETLKNTNKAVPPTTTRKQETTTPDDITTTPDNEESDTTTKQETDSSSTPEESESDTNSSQEETTTLNEKTTTPDNSESGTTADKTTEETTTVMENTEDTTTPSAN